MISAFTIGSSIYSISGRIRKVRWIRKPLITSPFVLCNFIDNPRRSCYQIQIIFSFQTFLNDLQMQKSEESTAELNPSAIEVSGSNCSDASFNCNFSNSSLRSGYFGPSAGYNPRKPLDLLSYIPEAVLQWMCCIGYRITHAGIFYVLKTLL